MLKPRESWPDRSYHGQRLACRCECYVMAVGSTWIVYRQVVQQQHFSSSSHWCSSSTLSVCLIHGHGACTVLFIASVMTSWVACMRIIARYACKKHAYACPCKWEDLNQPASSLRIRANYLKMQCHALCYLPLQPYGAPNNTSLVSILNF